MDCSPPGSSVHGISQARITGVVCHFLLQGNFLTQGAKLHLLHWQALACRFFISEPPGNALVALACTDVSSLGDEYRPWTSILQQMVRPTIYVVEVDSPYHQSLVSISLPFRVLTSSLEESWSFPQQCPTDGNIWFFFHKPFLLLLNFGISGLTGFVLQCHCDNHICSILSVSWILLLISEV